MLIVRELLLGNPRDAKKLFTLLNKSKKWRKQPGDAPGLGKVFQKATRDNFRLRGHQLSLSYAEACFKINDQAQTAAVKDIPPLMALAYDFLSKGAQEKGAICLALVCYARHHLDLSGSTKSIELINKAFDLLLRLYSNERISIVTKYLKIDIVGKLAGKVADTLTLLVIAEQQAEFWGKKREEKSEQEEPTLVPSIVEVPQPVVDQLPVVQLSASQDKTPSVADVRCGFFKKLRQRKPGGNAPFSSASGMSRKQ